MQRSTTIYPEKFDQSDGSDRWILDKVTGSLDEKRISAVFVDGRARTEYNWIFPGLARDEFLNTVSDLQSHVGSEVMSLINQPPTYLRIDFVDGAWGVRM
jgi:hypothetical protein